MCHNTKLLCRPHLEARNLPASFAGYHNSEFTPLQLRDLIQLFDQNSRGLSKQNKFTLWERLCHLRPHELSGSEEAAIRVIRDGSGSIEDARRILYVSRKRRRVDSVTMPERSTADIERPGARLMRGIQQIGHGTSEARSPERSSVCRSRHNSLILY
jgi:hypothetical protein